LLGFPAGPLVMSPKILLKIATGKDGDRAPLTEWQICHLPEYLDDPVAIFDHDQHVALVVLTGICDGLGNPVVCCVRPNVKDGIRVVNAITTAFGKSNATAWLAEQIQNEKLLYVGEKTNPRLPLPGHIYNEAGAHESEGSARIILRPADLIKYRKDSSAALLGIDPIT